MPKPKYSTFCEWVIGKNVQQIAAAQDKKKPAPTEPSPKRDVFRVEVTTDDEAEEDSLTVTYPRSAKSAPVTAAAEDVVTKKVRFQQMPTKSALKKSTVVGVESESTTDSESETTETESNEVSPEEKNKSKFTTKIKKKKKKRLAIDPNPHPTCKCGSCVRSRHHFKLSSDVSTSESDTETIANKPQPSKHKHVLSDSDYEASSEPSTKSETEAGPSAKAVEKVTDDKAKKASKSEATKQKEGRSHKVKIKARKGRSADKDYPEAMPGPHPRRPHLIEPIRAEVVQTERVVESAEDPPPNAYYDATHGVLRVYHGPVYGGRFGHALYPRRDASNHALPMGTPHPLHNPYLYGFDSGKQGQQSSFRPTYPPPPPAMADGGYAPMAYPPNGGGYPYSGFAPGGASAPWPPPAAPPVNGSRGAFSMFAANGASPFSRLGEEGGSNNVAPGSLQGNNPYYPGRSKSGPSATGSRAPDSGGQPDGGTDGAWPTSDGAADGARGSWGNEQTEANWNNGEQTGAPCPNGKGGDEPTSAMPGAWESQEQQQQEQQPSSGWDSRQADRWESQKPSPEESQW
ncbi:hypothetical protein GQ602_003631 [Ophiocordyceps camponoti-floridani]|uniref:Uncharacterized protein n=1 Tax=Ophiocordyceps camponoti-floridani TaxID=2030778 RepID=A0A8H4VEQ0_9HYPO|nr:hypothetical protein GQ602_003631 [Ophiocordyceps camponoti-floridani]